MIHGTGALKTTAALRAAPNQDSHLSFFLKIEQCFLILLILTFLIHYMKMTESGPSHLMKDQVEVTWGCVERSAWYK